MLVRVVAEEGTLLAAVMQGPAVMATRSKATKLAFRILMTAFNGQTDTTERPRIALTTTMTTVTPLLVYNNSALTSSVCY